MSSATRKIPSFDELDLHFYLKDDVLYHKARDVSTFRTYANYKQHQSVYANKKVGVRRGQVTHRSHSFREEEVIKVLKRREKNGVPLSFGRSFDRFWHKINHS